MIKTIKYFVQALIIYFFLFLGRILGLKLSRIIFSNIFLLLGNIFKSKSIIYKNFEKFSKKISEKEKEEIIKNMWKNYGMTFIEYIYLNVFRKSDIHVQLHGEENLKKVIENGKPVIFISGHFANFELMSMEITKKNINLATIYRPLNNFFLNPLMEFLRKKYVCENQIKKGIQGVREAINFIKKDYSIALMIDQRLSEGEKINFFGTPASTTTLPAQLAIKFNLSIIPVFILRNKNKFKIEYYDEIKSKNFNNKSDLSKKLNDILENMVLRNPDQWIWTHDRWK